MGVQVKHQRLMHLGRSVLPGPCMPDDVSVKTRESNNA